MYLSSANETTADTCPSFWTAGTYAAEAPGWHFAPEGDSARGCNLGIRNTRQRSLPTPPPCSSCFYDPIFRPGFQANTVKSLGLRPDELVCPTGFLSPIRPFSDCLLGKTTSAAGL